MFSFSPRRQAIFTPGCPELVGRTVSFFLFSPRAALPPFYSSAPILTIFQQHFYIFTRSSLFRGDLKSSMYVGRSSANAGSTPGGEGSSSKPHPPSEPATPTVFSCGHYATMGITSAATTVEVRVKVCTLERARAVCGFAPLPCRTAVRVFALTLLQTSTKLVERTFR